MKDERRPTDGRGKTVAEGKSLNEGTNAARDAELRTESKICVRKDLKKKSDSNYKCVLL